jgi:hypothetical protein
MPRKLAGPDRRDGGEKKTQGGSQASKAAAVAAKPREGQEHSRHAQKTLVPPQKGLTMLCRRMAKTPSLCQEETRRRGDGRQMPSLLSKWPPRAGILARPEWSSCRTKAGEWSIEFRSRSVRSCLFLLALFVNNASSHWMRQIV